MTRNATRDAEIEGLKLRVATLEREVRRLRNLAAAVAHEDHGGSPDHADDWPEGDYCPDCGNPESHCICDNEDCRCRSCGRASNCIDGGLCGMCFELQGGVPLPGQ